MPEVGPVELFLVLVVVVLLFGGTRLAELGGSLGKGVREFRRGIRDDDDAAAEAEDSAAEPAGAPICAKCGTANVIGARFCSNCGASLSA